jgi:hypothetical protein
LWDASNISGGARVVKTGPSQNENASIGRGRKDVRAGVESDGNGGVSVKETREFSHFLAISTICGNLQLVWNDGCVTVF